jgi:hypothetical protein
MKIRRSNFAIQNEIVQYQEITTLLKKEGAREGHLVETHDQRHVTRLV